MQLVKEAAKTRRKLPIPPVSEEFTAAYNAIFNPTNRKSKEPPRVPRPILCLDFDGVIHSYTSPWEGADIIPDPPVPGALEFIHEALQTFRVAVFSSRSGQAGGIPAMKGWLNLHARRMGLGFADASWLEALEFPREKPPAMVTLDDRALTFTGEWPKVAELLKFKPWNRR